jgi:hypothetical protein
MNSFGFIITRHVNSEQTNKYWNISVNLLRNLYPLQKIIIIDDNSNPKYVKNIFEHKNIQVIHSEFKGRGELLPYLYYLKNKFFENAIILHDSVFFHKRVNFEKLYGINVLPLWHFNADKENIINTLRISRNLLNSYNIQEKLQLKDNFISLSHFKWYGCFGVQSYINHNFLQYLDSKYRISNLIESVKCRLDRCCLERIFGCIFFTENQKIHNKKSLFGNIFSYQKWGYNFEQYNNDIQKKKLLRFIVKVWTGR